MRHFFHTLFASILLLNAVVGAPPENTGDDKKPAIKPPFPNDDADLLPPMKLPLAVEPAPAPRLNDTNKAFDVIMVAVADGAKPAEGRIAVGFFNHGDRNLTLEIDKRTVKLDSRHYLQLKLPREFTWREKDGPMQTTKVQADADGAEIVFRR